MTPSNQSPIEQILVELVTKWNSRRAENNFYTQKQRLEQAVKAVETILQEAENKGYAKGRKDEIN